MPQKGDPLSGTGSLPLSFRSQRRCAPVENEVSSSSSPCDPLVFRIGSSLEGRSSGTKSSGNKNGTRPQRWKRLAGKKAGDSVVQRPSGVVIREESHGGDTSNADEYSGKKSGGAVRAESSFWDFWHMTSSCKLRELQSFGNSLSWAGWRDRVWVQCRLDRSFGNDEWYNLFPRSQVEYMDMLSSDHRPIKVCFSYEPENVRRGRFYFDRRMLGKDGIEEAVRRGWAGGGSDVGVDLMERISNCRTGRWKVNLLRQTFTDEDAKLILKLKPHRSRKDSFKWGYTANGCYSSQSESDCGMAREAILNPTRFPWFGYLLEKIIHALPFLYLCSLEHVEGARNKVAEEIAVSVTRDHRCQSYIASGGRRWLLNRLESEARRA
ncbi:hypothetical protein F2Q69_00011738 [Brassica cretica]|uniref:Endonuclease/exonuclease/phosphatase domain-containing protein n=1 Tax=Brassica cretica TaxID=69181 RepID=A0A8S9QMV9_BRACR|nr:hypothetical protein F2Q69_00011738 [Brassica cretica]